MQYSSVIFLGFEIWYGFCLEKFSRLRRDFFSYKSFVNAPNLSKIAPQAIFLQLNIVCERFLTEISPLLRKKSYQSEIFRFKFGTKSYQIVTKK